MLRPSVVHLVKKSSLVTDTRTLFTESEDVFTRVIRPPFVTFFRGIHLYGIVEKWALKTEAFPCYIY